MDEYGYRFGAAGDDDVFVTSFPFSSIIMDPEHVSPIQCNLVDTGDGYLVMLAEDVPPRVASMVDEFNTQLLHGSDFIDSRGRSFGVTYPISDETLQKLEAALSCQTKCWMKFVRA